MIWISLIILMISIIINIRVSDKILNPSSLILFWWMIILLINAVNPFDWYDITDKTEFVLLIGILGMAAGTIFGTGGRMIVIKKKDEDSITLSYNRTNVKRMFFVIQFVLVILMIPFIVKAINILVKYNFNMYYVRHFYSTAGLEDSLMTTLERIIYIHYGVVPMADAFIFVDAMLCIKYGWKKPFFYLLVLTICVAVVSAGRMIIFNAGIALLFSYLYFEHENVLDKKNIKKIVRFFIVIMAIVVVYITTMRTLSDESTIKVLMNSISSYFAAGIRILDHTLQNSSQFGLNYYSFGQCIFGGLISIIKSFDHYLLGSIGLSLFSLTSDNIVQGYLEKSIFFSDTQSMNAFPTMFYYFLRDGGMLCVFVFSFILMYLVSSRWKKFMSVQSMGNGFKFLVLVLICIMGVCWWAPIESSFWFKLIWGHFIIRRWLFNNNLEE